MCEMLGKKTDIFLDSLKDLVYDKVGCNEHRLQAIIE